ncbi:MAG TPA: ECF-type sigma factor [Prosthecobacter sp.]
MPDTDEAEPRSAHSAELLPVVYDDLRRLARAMVDSGGGGDQTLSATALVHEAWLRVTKSAGEGPQWENRRHFFGAAAQAMRRILLNRFRDKGRLKRGGRQEHVALDEVEIAVPMPEDDLLMLDEALDRLAAEDPLAAEIVSLRYFVGLKWVEIADMTGIPERDLNRQWAFARAWLRTEMQV